MSSRARARVYEGSVASTVSRARMSEAVSLPFAEELAYLSRFWPELPWVAGRSRDASTMALSATGAGWAVLRVVVGAGGAGFGSVRVAMGAGAGAGLGVATATDVAVGVGLGVTTVACVATG